MLYHPLDKQDNSYTENPPFPPILSYQIGFSAGCERIVNPNREDTICISPSNRENMRTELWVAFQFMWDFEDALYGGKRC